MKGDEVGHPLEAYGGIVQEERGRSSSSSYYPNSDPPNSNS